MNVEPGRDRPGQHAVRPLRPVITTAPNLLQARLGADLLRERAVELSDAADKLRTAAQKGARNGTPTHITQGRYDAATAHDDHAAELFALADWIERAAHTEE